MRRPGEEVENNNNNNKNNSDNNNNNNNNISNNNKANYTALRFRSELINVFIDKKVLNFIAKHFSNTK